MAAKIALRSFPKPAGPTVRPARFAAWKGAPHPSATPFVVVDWCCVALDRHAVNGQRLAFDRNFIRFLDMDAGKLGVPEATDQAGRECPNHRHWLLFDGDELQRPSSAGFQLARQEKLFQGGHE